MTPEARLSTPRWVWQRYLKKRTAIIAVSVTFLLTVVVYYPILRNMALTRAPVIGRALLSRQMTSALEPITMAAPASTRTRPSKAR